MKQAATVKQKTRQLLIILFPILVTQLSLFAMTFFDTLMSGHASARDLAGVAVGASLWAPVFTGLSGILLALTPTISHLLGAGEKKKAPFEVIQGIYLAMAIGVAVLLAGFLFLNPILTHMKLEADVKRIAHDYLIALSFGIFPLFIYTVLRCFIDSLGQTITTMIISLFSLPINVGLNYLLIFGKLGFPRLGGVGAGYASAITYWCIIGIAILVIQKKAPFCHYQVFGQFYRISLRAWKELLRIGLPIGFSIFFETSIFAAVTLLMSEFSTETIAAHQAAINFASLLYMIPMSISMALTITVGFEAGAKRYRHARQYSYLGIGISTLTAALCAIGLLLWNGSIAKIYTTDPTVITLTKDFLIYAIFFQFSDGIAAPIQGVLRGYKDVNVTFFMTLVSYWVLGLPIGLLLARYTSFGAFGYWMGLIAGLAFGAFFLSFRLVKLQKQHIPLRETLHPPKRGAH